MGICISCTSTDTMCFDICKTSHSHIYYTKTQDGTCTRVTKHFTSPIEFRNPYYTNIIRFLLEHPSPHVILIHTIRYDFTKPVYASTPLRTPMPSVHVEMEYIRFDLFEYLKTYDHEITNENRIRFASSMISAVQWLHTNNIIHFDIKLENFMVFEDSYTVKLIDFESATWKNETNSRIYLRTTEEFIAPEYHNYKIRGFHNDIWSLGIALFILFEGTLCFDNRTICLCEEVPSLTFTKTPALFQSIIEHCIEYDYLKRITIEEISQLLK